MAKWEIIEDNKFKKGNGGKSTATRAVATKNSKNNPKMLSEVTVVEPKTVTKNKPVIQKPNLAPYYVPAQDASKVNTFVNDKQIINNQPTLTPLINLSNANSYNTPNPTGSDSLYYGVPYKNGEIADKKLWNKNKILAEEETKKGYLESAKTAVDIGQTAASAMELFPLTAPAGFALNAGLTVPSLAIDYYDKNYVGIGADVAGLVPSSLLPGGYGKAKTIGEIGYNAYNVYDDVKDIGKQKDTYQQYKKIPINQNFKQIGGKVSGWEIIDDIPKAQKGLTIKTPFSNLTPTQPVQEKPIVNSIPTTVKPQYKSEGDYLNQVYGEDSGVQLPGQSSVLRASQDAKPAYDVTKKDYSSYNKEIQEQKIDEQVAKFLKANPLPESKSDKADYIENLSPYDRQLIQSSSFSNQFLPAFRQYENRIGENAKKYSLKEAFSDPDKASEVAQLGLNRFRLFPNATNSYEDLINPGIWFGQMEQGVADIPKNIRDENYLGAAMGVVNPLAMGALGAAGSKSTGQWLNNMANPLAGIVDANTVKGLGNKALNKYAGKSFTPELGNVGVEALGAGKPTVFKSEINWGKWNKEIPENKALMQEYNAIEQQAKADGRWMKNPDGSKFQGTPEQFVQESSQNFKKAYPEGYDNVYRGERYNIDNYERGNTAIFTSSDKDVAKLYANPENPESLSMHHPDINSSLNKPTNQDDYTYSGLKELLIPKGIKKVEGTGFSYNNLNDNLKIREGVYDDVLNNWDNEVRTGLEQSLPLDLTNFNKYAERENYLSQKRLKTDIYADYLMNTKNNELKEPLAVIKDIYDGGWKIKQNTFIVNPNKLNIKSRWYNNGMFDMTNPNIYKSVAPFAIGLGAASALQQKKHGGIIEDPRGQWAHPGSVTRIPSNQITMQGVNYPVLGISDRGHTQMMYPGEDYSFRGKSVTEYPMMESGGEVNFTYAGENHRVYEKESPTGNGKGIEGHIMVNHPTENKGKWDTIDLTKITNGKVKTVAQGVASTKKWHKENPEYADGGMIKRADGSYSKRGLWDNIRDNAGSGKKPTKEMLKQERKIKSQYANGGQVSSWKIIEDLPKAQNGRFTNPPIYVNDPKDPRLKMYNDSLISYNAGEQNYKNYLLETERLPKTSKWVNNHPYIPGQNNQPISSHGLLYDKYGNVLGTHINTNDYREAYRYKKPIQPYILQTTPPILPPTPGSVITNTQEFVVNTPTVVDSTAVSTPKGYVTITTGSSYRNPATGAFEQKTFKIDKTTGKRISEDTFKEVQKPGQSVALPAEFKKGGKTKKSNWQIIEY